MAIRRRVCSQGEDGVTLVEVIVSMALVALVVALAMQQFGAADRTGSLARAGTQATAVARKAIEAAQSLGFDALAHLPGQLAADPNVSAGKYDPDASGPLAAEDVVVDPDGGLDPYVTTETHNAVDYEARRYVTASSDATRRLSVLVLWTVRGRPRTTTMSTIVSPEATALGASARVLSGTLAGQHVQTVAPADVDSTGGSETASAQSFQPISGISGSGGTSTASVDAATPTAHADSAASSISVSVGPIVVSASGVSVAADSSSTGTSASATGTVSINGIPIVNPAPGTVQQVGVYRIVLNDQRQEVDGSRSVAFVRVTGPDTDLTLCWAWVLPVAAL